MKTFLGFFLLLIWYRSISESPYLNLILKKGYFFRWYQNLGSRGLGFFH